MSSWRARIEACPAGMSGLKARRAAGGELS
jgi:hypothetical protein